jgi:hypothetical protein
MASFILLGSKGGAGRTASSVVLATGLSAIGLRPLHLQITMPGVSPAIATAKGLPFSAAWIPEDRATRYIIHQAIAAHPECTTLVIDMPKRTVREVGLFDLNAAVLFPVRRAGHEIEVAVRDYRDLDSQLEAVDDHDDISPSRQCSGWLLPVGWPPSNIDHDFASSVARFDTSTRSGLSPPSILMPGIPELPRDDLDDLINGTSFHCSPTIADAAILIARAAT